MDNKNPAAKDASKTALERMGAFNRRTLDVLHARLVFYYSLAHELFSELAEVRPVLLSLHRTAGRDDHCFLANYFFALLSLSFHGTWCR